MEGSARQVKVQDVRVIVYRICIAGKVPSSRSRDMRNKHNVSYVRLGTGWQTRLDERVSLGAIHHNFRFRIQTEFMIGVDFSSHRKKESEQIIIRKDLLDFLIWTGR